MAESQRAISIAEFFDKNKQMLGFDSGARGLVTAVKEAVDNALDATEEAGIKPDISVKITESGDYYKLVVEDNGPGITREQIPKVFGKLLYGSRFHTREQSLTPEQQLLVRRDGEVDFVPIGVLCDAYLPQGGSGTAPVADDIEVPSFDRETHEMTWEGVTHAIRHETDEAVYRVTTERGRTVEVTGNHSLFSVSPDGDTAEVKAGNLSPGDTVLAPQRLPAAAKQTTEINVLEHIRPSQLDGRRVYVYGFDEETIAELRSEETVRKKPSPDSDRRRYYYRHDGVEILRDSLEGNYIEEGYLPAETVLELGWEDRAADCELKTYQVGGEETTVPVTIPVDDSFVELLAYYVSEGHAGPRQVGFTFGSHESGLIEATEEAVTALTGSTTTVERERNSTRVKAFGSPLAMFLESVCGDAADTKRIPSFVFDLDPGLQKRFIAALYRGDGSDRYPNNELSHTTASETLARQLSVLWNIQGVVASTESRADASGYSDGETEMYRTKVYGEDAEVLDVFGAENPAEQRYKRVPTSLLEDVAVGNVTHDTVPDTIPGLLMGAGIGSSTEHAAEYQSLIEAAIAGEQVDAPRYAHNLTEYGLLSEDGRATEELADLWEAVRGLHGLTDTDVCLLSVKSIEEIEPPEYVYDISVPGASGRDENFVVANDGALCVKNSRGQQGIGISAAVLYAQKTSGKPAKITSRTQNADRAQYFELIIDTDTNEPEISVEEERAPGESDLSPTHGTRIELEMEANMRARQQLHDYTQQTAVINPHARLVLDEPGFDEPRRYERVEGADLPAETEEIRPHPHGVELGTLITMLEATESYSVSGFLRGEFTRVGSKTATKVLDNLRDRHFGREMGWAVSSGSDVDLEAAVEDAVANKGAEATAAFASRVADALSNRERTAHSALRSVIDTVGEDIESEFGTTFGSTVRENAADAAWTVLTTDIDSELYAIVDEATSTRKDAATVEGLTDRLADKFREAGGSHRATRSELEAYVDRSANQLVSEDVSFGETARENVVEAVWSVMRTVPDDVPRVSRVADDRDTASELLDAMRETDILAPPTNCLSPITAELVEAGLRKEYDADFYAAATRDAEVHGGDPFIVEAGIAHGGELEDGTVGLLRFANRVPLVYQRGACATTDVVKRIGWRNYGLDQPGGSGMPSGPAVVMIHVASTNVPFTSESKDAIANIPAIEDEIELAVREAARELKSYLKKRRSMQKRREKQDVLGRILPEMADKLSEVTSKERPTIDGALARIMNNVSVERSIDGDTVSLTVENHSDRAEEPEITEIVSAEPADLPDDGSVVNLDGEWFITWTPSVPAGESATLTYTTAADAAFDIDIDGIEAEKLTIDA
ncbi:ATP-binding protein [Halobellus salinus]|uniref:ATP-binding protein n=1 Tax=Halobellus salinus TaxID=931585 RepID=UPI003742ED0C